MHIVLVVMMYYILPYLTVVVFLGGLIYNIISWLRTPAPSTELSVYPKPSGAMVAPSLAIDEIIFPRMFSRRILWVFGVMLHLSLLGIAVGHIRIFGEPQFVWNILRLNEQGVDTFAYIVGGTVGIAFLVALLVLLARRFFGIMKRVSIPIDYLVLILLIAVAISGDYMRFFMHLDMSEVQTYFASLVRFNPIITPTILEPAFVVHNVITQSLLIYIPFSKIVHMVGSFVTNYLVKRRDKK